MLPKKARLSSRQLSFVLRKPTAKVFSKHITCIYYTKEITDTVVSFGIAMQKKLFTNSVDMHRKRRVVYARIRESDMHTSLFLPQRLFLVVLLPKNSFFALSHSEQIEELQHITRQMIVSD